MKTKMICKHCNKEYGQHQAIYLNCPLPGRGLLKSFNVSKWFELKGRKSKNLPLRNENL